MGERIETGFVAKTIEMDGVEYRYAVYVPADYTPRRSRPLFLSLHGIGERGQDGMRHTTVGIGKAIREHPERFACIVVMPQCRPGENWQARMVELALRAVDDAVAQYNVDEGRIVLTGLSMGGYGTWRVGSTHTDRFCALVPVCGGGDPTGAEKLARLPIWCWHGDADAAVPVERSREMVKAVRNAGGDVRYTELPGVGHNSWDAAYGNPELIEWMLEQKRN